MLQIGGIDAQPHLEHPLILVLARLAGKNRLPLHLGEDLIHRGPGAALEAVGGDRGPLAGAYPLDVALVHLGGDHHAAGVGHLEDAGIADLVTGLHHHLEDAAVLGGLHRGEGQLLLGPVAGGDRLAQFALRRCHIHGAHLFDLLEFLLLAGDLRAQRGECAGAGLDGLGQVGFGGLGAGAVAVALQLGGAAVGVEAVVALRLGARLQHGGALAVHLLVLGQACAGELSLQAFHFVDLRLDLPLLGAGLHLLQLALREGHVLLGLGEGGGQAGLAVEHRQGLALFHLLTLVHQDVLHAVAAQGGGHRHLADAGFGFEPPQGRDAARALHHRRFGGGGLAGH